MGGGGSLTQEGKTTRRVELPAAARIGEGLSELINDLHVWFRSFRVKLSRLREVCARFNLWSRGCFAVNSAKLLPGLAFPQDLP